MKPKPLRPVGVTTGATVVPLAMILFYVISQGAAALNWAFFTQLNRRPLVPYNDPYFENAVEHGKGH